jgi:beta-glucosidase
LHLRLLLLNIELQISNIILTKLMICMFLNQKNKLRRCFIFILFVYANSINLASAQGQSSDPLFRNSNEPVEKRVKDLLGRLTLEEKISLLGFRSKAVTRLGIPAYNWWNEALHGVARAGKATVFPQAIAMAATFNDDLLNQVADVISTEARAKYNLSTGMDRRLQYMGLTFWSPNINIFRDPRWGRGQETYGEDPFLTASMGTAFVKGMQGNDPGYLKTAACAKHFAAHSGPEAGRHSFNAIVDEKDLRETYLYAFKKLVDAGVESVMCGYNRLNDQPCCTNDVLLRQILRNEWKFKGHLVTDCWALEDIWKAHKVMKNSVEVAAAALKAGVNLDCSNMLQDDLMKAFQQKLITETEVDSSLAGILRTQFRLGFYDDKSKIPFSTLGEESVHTPKHIELARIAARQSMVLLKNDKGILPLNKEAFKSIMVLGPNAGALDPLVANYHGMSGGMVTFAEGITEAAGAATAVQYDQGSDFTDTVHFGGIWAAGESDLAIAVIGLTPVYEGEEGDAFLAANGGDKLSLDLPAAHIKLLKELRKKNKPVVVVVTAGSAVDIAAIEPYADAIILAWYPGEQGGNALADILFGKVSPSGRLPVTFYQSLRDLPPYESYNVSGRTYRYFNGKVQYPFGYGLSYTSFEYKWAKQPGKVRSLKDSIVVSVSLKNTGAMDGDEVMQVYVQYPNMERMPVKELKGFKRVEVPKGAEHVVHVSIPVHELQKWDLKEKRWRLYPGSYRILVGSSSQDIKLDAAIQVEKGVR